MPSQKPPPESPANGAGSDPPETPFEALTKKLLTVPLEKVKVRERQLKGLRQKAAPPDN